MLGVTNIILPFQEIFDNVSPKYLDYIFVRSTVTERFKKSALD
jgi:hypothetical protein